MFKTIIADFWQGIIFPLQGLDVLCLQPPLPKSWSTILFCHLRGSFCQSKKAFFFLHLRLKVLCLHPFLETALLETLLFPGVFKSQVQQKPIYILLNVHKIEYRLPEFHHRPCLDEPSPQWRFCFFQVEEKVMAKVSSIPKDGEETGGFRPSLSPRWHPR